MLKFLYELFTSPLGLPINPIWEWLIILVVGEIAHEIAYWVSPGGKEFGSLIYWVTKLLTFIAMWAILYGIIVAIQFVARYWIWFLCIGIGISSMTGIIAWIVRYKKKKKGAEQQYEKNGK